LTRANTGKSGTVFTKEARFSRVDTLPYQSINKHWDKRHTFAAGGGMELRRAVAALMTAALLAGQAVGLGDQYIEDTDRFPGWRGELPTTTIEVQDSVGYGEVGKVSP